MITIDRRDGFVVAKVRGDIDMANTGSIDHAIAGNVTSEDVGVVVELSDVTYLDSAGIRLLYHLDERASDRQQQVVVVIPSGSPINRTLEAAGALGSLKIVPSVADAEALLGG